jgi:hypothetical protein
VFFTKLDTDFILYAPGSLTSASFQAVPFTAYGLNGTDVGGSAGGTDSGTVTGTVTTSTVLLVPTTTLAGSFTDAANNVVKFTATDSASNWTEASSLATVAGTYTASFSVGGTSYTPSLTINATTGAITGSDTTATCTYTGSVGLPDTTHNDYSFSLTSSCLSGQTFTGLGSFFPAGLSNPNGVLSKAELKVGLTNGSNTGIYLNLTQ